MSESYRALDLASPELQFRAGEGRILLGLRDRFPLGFLPGVSIQPLAF